MFDLGWSELLLVSAIALVVLGPKEIPRALRAVRKFFGKMRSLGQEFHRTMDEAARAADLEDIKRDLQREGDSLKTGLTEETLVPELDEVMREAKAVKEMRLAPDADAPEPEPPLEPDAGPLPPEARSVREMRLAPDADAPEPEPSLEPDAGPLPPEARVASAEKSSS